MYYFIVNESRFEQNKLVAENLFWIIRISKNLVKKYCVAIIFFLENNQADNHIEIQRSAIHNG